MFRLLAGGLVLALAAVPAAAEDKKDKAPLTAWVREVAEYKLTFELGKTTGRFHVFQGGENGVVVTGKVKVEKDAVTFEVTDVEEKGTFPTQPKKGDKFTFKWTAKGDTAKLSDLKGDDTEGAKPLVEGEYKKKK